MVSSSLLVRAFSLPMKKILGNCKSLSSALAANYSCRSPVKVVRKTVAPWLMLPPKFDDINGSISTVHKFYRLVERDVVDQLMTPDADSHFLGASTRGWIAYIQQRDWQVFLFNPFSGKKINLPSFETLPSVKGVIRNRQSSLVERIVLSSSPMDDDCIAVTWGHGDGIAYCRIGDNNNNDVNSWIALDSFLPLHSQIVFHSGKKLFFTLRASPISFTSRELEAWDLHNDPIKRIQFHTGDFGSDYWTNELESNSYCLDHDDYLVYDHQSQEFFVVTRYNFVKSDRDGVHIVDHKDLQFPLKIDIFKVHFINDDHVELQYLEGSLDNRAFFIGSNTGFALSTTEFPELRPNSIYFRNDYVVDTMKFNFEGREEGIYDYKEKSIDSCHYPIDLDKISPAPTWFTPDIVDAECLA